MVVEDKYSFNHFTQVNNDRLMCTLDSTKTVDLTSANDSRLLAEKSLTTICLWSIRNTSTNLLTTDSFDF